MELSLSTIIWICIIIMVIALIAYIYYYYTNQIDFFRSINQTVRRKPGSRRGRSNLTSAKKNQRPGQSKTDVDAKDGNGNSNDAPKQVRFKSDVSYKTFIKDPVSTPEAPIHTPSYRPHRSHRSPGYHRPSQNHSQNHYSNADEISLVTTQTSDAISEVYSDIDSASESGRTPIQQIRASNLEHSDADWDSGFGLPLMNPKDKAKYINKMRGDHDKYQQSMGQFGEYQMDRNTIIETDTTIDPFQTGNYDGLTIADIYDKHTSGPRAVAKKLSRRTNDQVIYSSEDEMNGGKLQGTHLQAFDNNYAQCQTAAFGDGFNL